MERGSPEWLQSLADQVGKEAQSKLIAIAEKAVTRHGLSRATFSQTDMVRIGTVIYEVQDQSFILGIQLGMKMVKDMVEGKL